MRHVLVEYPPLAIHFVLKTLQTYKETFNTLKQVGIQRFSKHNSKEKTPNQMLSYTQLQYVILTLA